MIKSAFENLARLEEKVIDTKARERLMLKGVHLVWMKNHVQFARLQILSQ